MHIETWFEEMIYGKPHGFPEWDKTHEVIERQTARLIQGKLYDADYYKSMKPEVVNDPMRMIIEPPKLDTASITDAPVRALK